MSAKCPAARVAFQQGCQDLSLSLKPIRGIRVQRLAMIWPLAISSPPLPVCSSKPVHLAVPQTFYGLFVHAVPFAWKAAPCTHSWPSLSRASGLSLNVPSSERSFLATPPHPPPTPVVLPVFCRTFSILQQGIHLYTCPLCTLGGHRQDTRPGTLWAWIMCLLE